MSGCNEYLGLENGGKKSQDKILRRTMENLSEIMETALHSIAKIIK